jgi:hypothetical protein
MNNLNIFHNFITVLHTIIMYYSCGGGTKFKNKKCMGGKIKEDQNLLHCNQQRCLNYSKTPLGLH